MENTDLVEEAKYLLEIVFSGAKTDGAHGLEHAKKVLENTDKALSHVQLPKDQILAIRLASLLHDADDRKFFADDSENAEGILRIILPSNPKIRELTLRMIDLVSCSKNGIDKKGIEEEWMFYPRWSDRLEALGKGGILRAYQYSLYRKRPLDKPNTMKTNSPILLYGMVATEKRFNTYMKKKESETFIDHFYDKLLHLRRGFTTENPYYKSEVLKRHRLMEKFVLEYCTTEFTIPELIAKHCF